MGLNFDNTVALYDSATVFFLHFSSAKSNRMRFQMNNRLFTLNKINMLGYPTLLV